MWAIRERKFFNTMQCVMGEERLEGCCMVLGRQGEWVTMVVRELLGNILKAWWEAMVRESETFMEVP